MNKIIKKILTNIESEGYRAYVVGGYVRDYLLKINSFDIDIATDMPLIKLEEFFPLGKEYTTYNALKFNIDSYNISITTFRKESLYQNNKPTSVEQTNSLFEDAIRRDFTINSLYMDKSKRIVDNLDGMRDIENRLIRVVGNAKKRLIEDNTRILRALRFMTTLDFELDYELKEFIINNRELIKDINYNIKKKELDKIFNSENVMKFISFIQTNNMLDYFELDFTKIVKTNNYLSIWAQMEFSNKYNFTKEESTIINNIKNILKLCLISNKEIYKYGLNTCMLAGNILGVSKNKISKMYKRLPLKTIKDLCISFEELEVLLDTDNPKFINKKKEIIIDNILEGKLKNKYNSIKEFIIKGESNG